MKWKRHDVRSYNYSDGNLYASLFAAASPQLWGWCVWFVGGKVAGVELSYKRAKSIAETWIAAAQNTTENRASLAGRAKALAIVLDLSAAWRMETKSPEITSHTEKARLE